MKQRDLYYERIPTKLLREDIRLLGTFLGRVIKDQEGKTFYKIVEKLRLLSKNTLLYENKNKVFIKISKEVKNLPEFGLTYMAHANWKKPPFPMLLNFLGNFDENWGGIAKPSNIDQGEMTAPENMVMGMVEINGMIIQGRLKWMFRSHQNFPIGKFEKQFNSILNSLNEIEENIDDLDESISKDDIDTINDLLGNINL